MARIPAHVTPRRVESRIPRTRSLPLMAASQRFERAPREIGSEDEEERTRRERRAGHPGPRANPPAVDELDEGGKPGADAEADAEGEAARPRCRRHEEAVPDEEGDEERPVYEEGRVGGALQQTREDRKPQAPFLRGSGGRRRDEVQARAHRLDLLGVAPRVDEEQFRAVPHQEDGERSAHPGIRHEFLEDPAEPETDESADERVDARAAERHAVGVSALAVKAFPQARDAERTRRNRPEEAGDKAHHEGQWKSRHVPLSSHEAFAASRAGA